MYVTAKFRVKARGLVADERAAGYTPEWYSTQCRVDA